MSAIEMAVGNEVPTQPVAANAGYPPQRKAWGILAILFLLSVLSLLDRNIISLMVSDIKRDHGLSEVQMGILMGVPFALFYSLGALPFGWALDRFNRPRVLWFGVTIWSIGTAACGLSRGFWSMFAARATVGAGEASMVPGTFSMLPDLFPPERLGLASSVYAMSSKVGAGASLAIGGLLLTIVTPSQSYMLPVLGSLHGWQLVFLMAGLPGLLIALLILLVRDPRARRPVGHVAGNFVDYGRFARSRFSFFFFHHTATLPMSTVMFGLYAWLPTFFMREHGVPAAQIGLWLGLALSVGPVIALPLHGWAADRWFQQGRRDAHLRYLFVALLASAPLLVASTLVAAPLLAVVLVGCFLFIACGYLALPSVALQLILPADLRGKGSSVLLMINGIVAAGSGPVLVAVLTEQLGGPQMLGHALAIAAGVGVPLSALLFFLALKPFRNAVAARP